MGGWPLGHGHPTLGRHPDRHHRSGCHRRPALRAVLLRTADRHGDSRRHHRAVPARSQGLHGVRVPRETLRRENALTDELSVPALARHVVRHDHRRPQRRPLGHLRLGHHLVRGADRHSHGCLHRAGRRAGGHLGRREADGRDRGRPARDRGRAHHAHARSARQRPRDRRCHRPPARVRLFVQPVGDIHLLVGHFGRHVSHAVVLRHRPEPGAALSGREVGRRSAQFAADERLLENPAAGADPADRCARVPVLHVHAGPDAVQSAAQRAGAATRASHVCRP